MSKKDFTLNERMASLEAKFASSDKYQTEKLDSIHKVLVGNGQPGLVSEFNRFKGIFRGVTISLSIIVSVLTLVVAFIK